MDVKFDLNVKMIFELICYRDASSVEVWNTQKNNIKAYPVIRKLIDLCSNQFLFFVQTWFLFKLDFCSNLIFVWIDLCSDLLLFDLIFDRLDFCLNWSLFRLIFVRIELCSTWFLFDLNFVRINFCLTLPLLEVIWSNWCGHWQVV